MNEQTKHKKVAIEEEENEEIERKSSYLRTYIQYTYPSFPNTYLPSGGFF